MNRFITCMIAVMAIALCSITANAEMMDREWCITLLEIKNKAGVPDSVAEPMAIQCAIFQSEAVEAVKRICKLNDMEERKTAADMFNNQHNDEYNLYALMVRALREYMELKCLGPAAAIMCYDVVKTDAEINTMFTIFRSRRALPNNKYR